MTLNKTLIWAQIGIGTRFEPRTYVYTREKRFALRPRVPRGARDLHGFYGQDVYDACQNNFD